MKTMWSLPLLSGFEFGIYKRSRRLCQRPHLLYPYHIMTAAHKSVAQSVYHAGVITEQILHKYKLFLVPESEGEEWESEEEIDRAEVEAEVEELEHEMVEAEDPGLPKKKLVQKGLVVNDSGEGFDGE